MFNAEEAKDRLSKEINEEYLKNGYIYFDRVIELTEKHFNIDNYTEAMAILGGISQAENHISICVNGKGGSYET